MEKVIDSEILNQLESTPDFNSTRLEKVVDPSLIQQLEQKPLQQTQQTSQIEDDTIAISKTQLLENIGQFSKSLFAAGLDLTGTPINKQFAANISRGTFEGGGAVAGGIVGTTAGPMGAVLGTGLGYGMGKKAADAIDVALGIQEPGTIPEELTESLRDVLTGATYEMGGQVLGNIAGRTRQALVKTVQWIKSKLPTITNEQAERKAGELLQPVMERMGRSPYAENVEEAQKIQQTIGKGFQPTLGQQSENPFILMKEKSLIRTSPEGGGAELFKEQQTIGSKAIREYASRQFPESETMDDVINYITGQKGKLEAQALEKQSLLAGKVGKLEAGKTPYTIGENIRNMTKQKLIETKPLVNEAYNAIPNVKIDTNDILDDIAKIKNEFQTSGYDLEDYPSGVIKHVINKITKTTPEGIQEATPTGYQVLRNLRTTVRDDIKKAFSKVDRNDRLIRRLQELNISIENSMAKVKDINPEIAQKYNYADKLYKETYRKIFRQGTVAEVLQQGIRGEETRIPFSEIPQKFFNNVDSAKDFTRTFGKGNAEITEYARYNLLEKASNPITKELDTNKLMQWKNRNWEVLKELGIEQEFDDLTKLKLSADKAMANVEQFNKSIASKLIGVDVEKAIETAISKNAKDTAQRMGELINIVKDNKTALNGLKKGFADFIMKQSDMAYAMAKLEATGGRDVDSIKILRQQIMGNYYPAMKVLYKDNPEKIKALFTIQRAYEIMARNTKGSIAGGSDTAENLMNALKQGIAGKAIPGFGRYILNIFTRHNDQQINAMMTRAFFDPEYAQTLVNYSYRPKFFEQKVDYHLKTLGLMMPQIISNMKTIPEELQKLDDITAQKIFEEAGMDKEKAQDLARQRGYEF